MAPLETLSTTGLDARKKLEYWNDVVCSTFTPNATHPADPKSFCGWLTRTTVGDLRLAEVYSDAEIVTHTHAHVARSRVAMFYLHLQLEGASQNRQDGRVAQLQAGDFTLCDSTRPYEIEFDSANRMLVLGVPEALLRRHIACPESLVALPLLGSRGLSGLFSRFLCDYWQTCRTSSDAMTDPRLPHAILTLLASALALIPQARTERSALAGAHRVRILNYIETHLGDPDLTPVMVARACNMTPRYLHHLFSDHVETVARYILRRRLEECSRAMTAQSQRGRTVTAIAFDYGFNSPTHFGRAFRARFGTTPRAYRRQQEFKDR
jgi:AraC-like DNA-binding protein